MNPHLQPNTTQVPDIILDKWMGRLSNSEFKIVMYVVRKTYGWGKKRDAISIRQMVEGIRKRDGTQLDYGTGLTERTVLKTVKDLVDSGLLIKEKGEPDERGGDTPSLYSLNMNFRFPDDSENGAPPSRKNEGPGDPPTQNNTPLPQNNRTGDAENTDPPVPQKSSTGECQINGPGGLQNDSPRDRQNGSPEAPQIDSPGGHQESRTSPPLKVPDTIHTETINNKQDSTFNVADEGFKYSSSRARDEAILSILHLTGDERSKKRFEQLWSIADQAGQLECWENAYRAVEARLKKATTPIERPGAYFQTVVTALLNGEGVAVPTGTPDERAGIRAQIQNSLPLEEDLGFGRLGL